MLTLSRIKNLLNNSDHSDELQKHVRWETKEPLEVEGLKFKNAERFGGREGSGEEHWIVFSVTDEKGQTQYFKVDGSYASYVGAELDWDALTEVESVEVMVSQWHPKAKK
jgi:hypothetical protein